LRDALPFYLKGFVTFGYKTGVRIDELKSLKWSQVDFENRIIRLEVGETKTDEGRMIPMDEELYEILKTQLKIRTQKKIILPWVFLNYDDTGPIKDHRRAWNRACRKAGIG
jgi:integrase